MRTIALLPILLLAACGDGGGNRGTEAQGAVPVQTATLTGLYESGAGPDRNQLCVVEARFGLVVRSGGERSCSGAGTVSREGERVRFAMAGAEPCTIEARIDGRRIAFAPDQPPGCAYYCADGARFAGVTLGKIGGTEEDALRAEDLSGGRLCG